MARLEPAAVLWDMDGTLIDTEPAWLRAERTLLNRWGSDLSEADLTDWVGIGLWDLAAVFQQRGVRLSADEIVMQLSEMVDHDVFAGELDWRPGARELAVELHSRGIVNVLVTMSTRMLASRVLSQLPDGVFSGLIAGEDTPRPKPFADPYLLGAEIAGVQPLDCIAIEDSLIGVNSAHAAGAFVIGVPNLLDLSEAPFDVLLPSLEIDAASVVQLYEHWRSGRLPRTDMKGM